MFPSAPFLPGAWQPMEKARLHPPSPGTREGFLFQFLAWASLMPTKTQCSALGGTGCCVLWQQGCGQD